jgi:hypothetical protein
VDKLLAIPREQEHRQYLHDRFDAVSTAEMEKLLGPGEELEERHDDDTTA